MKLTARAVLLAGGVACLLGSRALSDNDKNKQRTTPDYLDAIRKTAAMSRDSRAQALAARHGLQILDLTWEDTGRYKGSSVGPNISDMTIQVGVKDPRTSQFSVTCMPVMRFPNYSDKTADLDPREFTLLVGNQHGQPLKRVSLYDFLNEPTRYMTHPEQWKGTRKTLLAPRDTKVLVSAQACFLPVPKQGTATFNPVLFNYQSYSQNPAVLTILVTREGTSATIIDNQRDAFASGSAWGQRLFHNQNGQRASLTGQRVSDFKAANPNHPVNGQETPLELNAHSGMNMVLLVQVPLKQKPRPERKYDVYMAAPSSAPMGGAVAKSARSDVENAVIGHGEMEGPFTETGNLKIERDERFPVRVTVQFYKATSNGVVDEKDAQEIHDQISRVYAQSDYVGSLVTEGATGRVTEYDGAKVQPADWWERFWERHQANTGDSREVAMAKLRALLGRDYMNKPVTDLYVRTLLRHPKKQRG